LLSFKEHVGEVYGVSWNHNVNNLVASGGFDSNIKLYDIVKGVSLGQFNEHKNVVYNVNWHPTMPSVFASSSGDTTLKIWDTKMGK
jgi:peroxin-7